MGQTPVHQLRIGENQMKSEDAARIQSHADRTGRNQDFKERSQSAAERNEDS